MGTPPKATDDMPTVLRSRAADVRAGDHIEPYELDEAANEIERLRTALEFTAACVAAERKRIETQLVAIKYELNGMALIGVKPMWGSLIGRLDQMIADSKSRTG